MELQIKETNMVEVFCRYITRNGKKIYPKDAKFFHFWVKDRSTELGSKKGKH